LGKISVGRPVDRVDRPWPTRPKPKTATAYRHHRHQGAYNVAYIISTISSSF